MNNYGRSGSRTSERSLVRYDFEGGGYIWIIAGGDVDTTIALEMAATLLELKRQEIASAAPAETGDAS